MVGANILPPTDGANQEAVMGSTQRVERKARTHLDLLSIPQLAGENVRTFRWDQRLQIQNLSSECDPGATPAGKTLPHSYVKLPRCSHFPS